MLPWRVDVFLKCGHVRVVKHTAEIQDLFDGKLPMESRAMGCSECKTLKRICSIGYLI